MDGSSPTRTVSIRLSRLPENSGSGSLWASAPMGMEAETETSDGPRPRVTRPKALPIEKSPLPSSPRTTRSSKSKSKKSPKSKKGKSAVNKTTTKPNLTPSQQSGSGSAQSQNQVKIKLNFGKKQPTPNTTNGKDSTDIGSKSEPSTSGSNQDKKTSSTYIPTTFTINLFSTLSSASKKRSEDLQTHDTEYQDNISSTSSEVGKDDYEYRPLRAAAAAALEAVVQTKRNTSRNDEENGSIASGQPRLRTKAAVKHYVPKGRSRRTIAKRAAQSKGIIRGVFPKPGLSVNAWAFHDDEYYQRGDIVAVLDEDGGDEHFCQVQGFLTDHSTNGLVELLWLELKIGKPSLPFIPANYQLRTDIDPQMFDSSSIKLVMRLPHNYYTDHEKFYDVIEPGTIYCRAGDSHVFEKEDAPVPNIQQNVADDANEQTTSTSTLDAELKNASQTPSIWETMEVEESSGQPNGKELESVEKAKNPLPIEMHAVEQEVPVKLNSKKKNGKKSSATRRRRQSPEIELIDLVD